LLYDAPFSHNTFSTDDDVRQTDDRRNTVTAKKLSLRNSAALVVKRNKTTLSQKNAPTLKRYSSKL